MKILHMIVGKAKAYVKTGGSVFAYSRKDARSLAIEIGDGASPEGPEKHGGLGYFWHYHPYKHKGGHIFYIK